MDNLRLINIFYFENKILFGVIQQELTEDNKRQAVLIENILRYLPDLPGNKLASEERVALLEIQVRR